MKRAICILVAAGAMGAPAPTLAEIELKPAEARLTVGDRSIRPVSETPRAQIESWWAARGML